MRFIRGLYAAERGASSIEYALIATFIAIVVFTGISALGGHVVQSFSNISNGFH